jgi:hypothetical protein
MDPIMGLASIKILLKGTRLENFCIFTIINLKTKQYVESNLI